MEKINLILFIATFQIFLMLSTPITTSYEINGLNVNTENVFGGKDKDLGIVIGELFISLVYIKQIGFVSAQESVAEYCCLEDNNKAICQSYSSNLISSVCSSENIVMSKCSETSICKEGTCKDSVQGTCTPRSTKGACEESDGEWIDDVNANVAECRKGCCVLGENVEYSTETRCEYLSSTTGFEKDFRQAGNELECLAMKEEILSGACVYGDEEKKDCRFISANECLSSGGNFYEGFLCSAESLNSICEKQASVSCVEGRDEIYWFDSCGNMENIYSSNREASYNNGRVLSKADSCNSVESNSGSSSCGNCNYLLGSKCSDSSINGVESSNLICEDLNCEASEETSGVERYNGESWCVYDGYIGEGKDSVGSRHWKRMCVDGKVEVEPCADYRGEVCVQSDIDVGDGENIGNAACVVNRALECVSYNKNKDLMESKCKENFDCQLNQVKVDEGFTFNICTGKYPSGFDLSGESSRGKESAEQICGMASQKCTVIYVKELDGWECVYNCDCETKKFTDEMNDLCISLGDCGSYVNYIGKGSDSYKVKNAPKISWKDYVGYSEVVPGQKADSESIESLNKRIGKEGNDNSSNLNSIIGISGAVGVTAFLAAKMLASGGEGKVSLTLGGISKALGFAGKGTTGAAGAVYDPVMGMYVNPGEISYVTGMPVSPASGLSAFANVLGGLAIGMSIGGFVAKAFGLQGQGAMAVVIGGAVGGAIGAAGASGLIGGAGSGAVGGAIGGAATSISAAFGGGFLGGVAAAGVFALVVALVVAAVMKILGIGRSKEVIVEFQCLPWQAPIGGEDCDKCNGDKLMPCTEYRCSSLGQACKLINEESTNPVCVEIENDGKSPIISKGNISQNFIFSEENEQGVKIRTTNGECIPSFTPVLFELNTNERAQCKYDFSQGMDIEEMSEFPLSGNYYLLNHTYGFSAPSLESLQQLGLEISGDVKQRYADFRMYVRCQDVNGNKNEKDYVVDMCISSGEDKTAPMITALTPVNNAKIKKDLSEIEFNVYTNEPTTCKYDKISDKSYDEMSYEMICDNEITSQGIYGWNCKTNSGILNEGENKFYIRCKDQPWLIGSENESKRNVNSEDYVYTLLKTKDELKIDSTLPSGIKELGNEPSTVYLEVKTSGGAENGKAECSYSFIGYDNTITFFDSYSTNHKQTMNLISGNYNIYVKCEDVAGNIALGNIIFDLNLDSQPPRVVRIFSNSGVEIKTDEEAQCYYDLERCNFNLENGTLMTTGLSTDHSAEMYEGKTYNIRCKDVWGNVNPGCAIKIKPN